MGDRAREIAAYEHAAKVADRLLAEGLPLLKFEPLDMGASVGFLFQLDGAKYAVRCRLEEATPARVRELYEAVA